MLSLMDRRILLDGFRYITSLASFANFAYTFTMLHSIQYSMRDHHHENNNSNAETLHSDATVRVGLVLRGF